MVSVEEYLTTSFNPDRDYVDGELEERNFGEQPHSYTNESRGQAPAPSDPIVRRPPFLCVEILSPEDRVSRLNERLSDYFQMCVRYVWVLDLLTRRAFCYTPGEMREVLDGMLRTKNPDLAVPLEEVFEA
jgi:Uma2 family endonuclease